jgi:hypothetical protein
MPANAKDPGAAPDRECSKPKLGRIRGKDYRHFLPVCYFDPGGIATANEYVALWQSASRYQIEILKSVAVEALHSARCALRPITGSAAGRRSPPDHRGRWRCAASRCSPA